MTAALKFGAVVFSLFAFLFAGDIWATSPDFIGFFLREITAVCRDAATQWMLVLCLACYFIMLVILEQRSDLISHPTRPGNKACKTFSAFRVFFRGNIFNPGLCLAVLIFLALLRYVLTYDTSSHSTQILVLMTGIVFGKAVVTWAQWESDKIEIHVVFLIRSLVCLFAAAALWQPDAVMRFQYHAIPRWSGVWDSPNLYGLLMGVGVVLAAGQITGTRRWTMEDGRSLKTLCVILCFCAAIFCGIGLFKSYGRGAWLGTVCGGAYLIAKSEARSQKSEVIQWVLKNALSIGVIISSIFVFAFWQSKSMDGIAIKRAFSIGNQNDFSWHNRVTAWEGDLQMMTGKPWFGFDWNQPEPMYKHYYLPPKLTESMAIQMNDYLMVGATLGIPALFCFGMYLWLSLTKKLGARSEKIGDDSQNPESRIQNPELEQAEWLKITCRAGAIVLLVGFWFDGGLFKLATASTFWILLELGNIQNKPRMDTNGH